MTIPVSKALTNISELNQYIKQVCIEKEDYKKENELLWKWIKQDNESLSKEEKDYISNYIKRNINNDQNIK